MSQVCQKRPLNAVGHELKPGQSGGARAGPRVSKNSAAIARSDQLILQSDRKPATISSTKLRTFLETTRPS